VASVEWAASRTISANTVTDSSEGFQTDLNGVIGGSPGTGVDSLSFDLNPGIYSVISEIQSLETLIDPGGTVGSMDPSLLIAGGSIAINTTESIPPLPSAPEPSGLVLLGMGALGLIGLTVSPRMLWPAQLERDKPPEPSKE
jgi:hypothetical protein